MAHKLFDCLLKPALAAFASILCGIATAETVAIDAAPTVLVTGDGVAITSADLQAEAERLSPELRTDVLAKREQVDQLATALYVRRALAQQAELSGLANQAEIAAALRIAREKLLAEAFVDKAVKAMPPPDETAVAKLARQTYDVDEIKFSTKEQRRVRHILIAAETENGEAKARALLDQVRAGADFATLAEKESADTKSAKQGGDLGFFIRGRMIKAFEDAAFGLRAAGDLAGPVKTKFGWHLLRLEEIKPAAKRPFAEVAEDIKREVRKNLLADRRINVVGPIREKMRVDTTAVEAFAKANAGK